MNAAPVRAATLHAVGVMTNSRWVVIGAAVTVAWVVAACGSSAAPAAGDWSGDGVSIHYEGGLAPGDVEFAPLLASGGCICGAAIQQASGLRSAGGAGFRYKGANDAGLAVAVVDTSGDAALQGVDDLPDSELSATGAQLGIPPVAPAGATYRLTRLTVAGLPAGRIDIGHAFEQDGQTMDQTHWVVLDLAAQRIYTLECQSKSGDGDALRACEDAVGSLRVSGQ